MIELAKLFKLLSSYLKKACLILLYHVRTTFHRIYCAAYGVLSVLVHVPLGDRKPTSIPL